MFERDIAEDAREALHEDVEYMQHNIDALVAALERLVAERGGISGAALEQSYAALALARGEG
jgi:hypothetical protein